MVKTFGMELSRVALWWSAMMLSMVVLPLLPSLAVIATGFMFPGIIPWSAANLAITFGSIFSVCACGALLFYCQGPVFMRVLSFALITLIMTGFSQFEFFTSQECISQQGKYIELQRQYREIQVTKGKPCG